MALQKRRDDSKEEEKWSKELCPACWNGSSLKIWVIFPFLGKEEDLGKKVRCSKRVNYQSNTISGTISKGGIRITIISL